MKADKDHTSNAEEFWKWALAQGEVSVDSTHHIPLNTDYKQLMLPANPTYAPRKIHQDDAVFAAEFSLVGETAKAYNIEGYFTEDRIHISAWFPKSQCELSPDGEIFCITKWIFERKVADAETATREFGSPDVD